MKLANIRRGLLLTVLIFSLMLPVFAQDEPVLQLPVLTEGETITDSLTEEVTTRLYAFNATEGDIVTISMTQITEELDPFVVLLGPAGQVIASDDDSGETSFSSLISEVELPITGSYFIVASSFFLIDDILDYEFEVEALEYELTVSGFTVPELEGDADFQYLANQLTSGETTPGASTPEEPVFFYTFAGTAGQTVDLTLSSEEFDTILYLFAPGGQRIAVNDDAEGTNSAITGIELPEDGLYFVFATDVYYYNAHIEDDEAVLTFTGGEFEITLNASN